MAGTLARHFLLRDLEVGAGGDHVEARSGRGHDPRLDVVGARGRERKGLAQRREAFGHLAEQHLQRPALDLEVVQVRDRLGDRLVVSRLGFQGIDDGRGSDLEVALGLRELLVDRGLLRFRQRHVVLGEQHVEVGLGEPQPQVLQRASQHRLGLQHQVLRLVDRDPALQAQDRLRERHRDRPGVVVAVGDAVALGVVAEDRAGRRDLRQVARARLGQALGRGLVLAARGLVDGVAHACVAVEGDQVRAADRGRGNGGGESDGDSGEFHRVFFRVSFLCPEAVAVL